MLCAVELDVSEAIRATLSIVQFISVPLLFISNLPSTFNRMLVSTLNVKYRKPENTIGFGHRYINAIFRIATTCYDIN